MIKGSCLCNSVKYEISDSPIEITNCYCSLCRKANGSAFVSFARLKQDTFKFTSGEDLINYYNSSEFVKRGFCSKCGSQVVFKYDKTPHLIWVTAGTLDDDPGIKPHQSIFVSSKPIWYEITDQLPQHEEYPRRK